MLRARGHDHLGIDHAAFGIERHVHRQLAVELSALVLGKIARAALLDAAPQAVVVERVGDLAGGRADVALARLGVVLVDAPFDLGQHVDHLAAALLLRHGVGGAVVAARVGRGQGGDVAAQLRQKLALRLARALLGALPGVGAVLADFELRRRGQRRRGPAGVGRAAAGQIGLGHRLRQLGRLGAVGVDEDHFERRVVQGAVEALRVAPAQGEDGDVQRRRDAEGDLQGGQAHRGSRGPASGARGRPAGAGVGSGRRRGRGAGS